MRMWRALMLRSSAGEASPMASRMMSPPALRTVIISKALRLCDSARTESAATMKAASVPLIQNTSQPSWAGRARRGRRRIGRSGRVASCIRRTPQPAPCALAVRRSIIVHLDSLAVSQLNVE